MSFSLKIVRDNLNDEGKRTFINNDVSLLPKLSNKISNDNYFRK